MSDKQIFLHGVRAFGACGPYEEMDSVITEVSVRVSQETQDGCQLLRTGKAKVERFEEVPENPDVLIDVMFDVMIIKPDVTYIIDLSGSVRCYFLFCCLPYQLIVFSKFTDYRFSDELQCRV